MKINTWIISDTHFGHENILKFEPINRPYKTIEEHDIKIIKQWNHYIKPTDVVYHLGDIGMKCTKTYMKDIFKQLNGTKILVRGNHDKYTDGSIYELGFSAILQEAKLKIGKKTIIKLSHYPYIEAELDQLEYTPRYPELRPAKEDMWLVHGHSHGNTPQIDVALKQINICWDHWHRPVRTEEILKIIQENK